MKNEGGSKQSTVAKDHSLQSPQPPKQVEPRPARQDSGNRGRDDKNKQDELNAKSSEIVKGPAKKVQDHDWNNGRPEVTPNDENVLDSHKTPEIKNEESLRENKGNKQGENVFEASEEVETGQNAG
jgi:hypothetical protein